MHEFTDESDSGLAAALSDCNSDGGERGEAVVSDSNSDGGGRGEAAVALFTRQPAHDRLVSQVTELLHSHHLCKWTKAACKWTKAACKCTKAACKW